MALAAITLPLSSTRTWTLTGPDAPAARATGGYGGCGSEMALPFRTPPATLLGVLPGRSVGCGVSDEVIGGGYGVLVVVTAVGAGVAFVAEIWGVVLAVVGTFAAVVFAG